MKMTIRQNLKHEANALFAAVISSLATGLFAVPACPDPVTVTQHDGEAVTVYLRGDERMSWHEDADGYTVVLDEATKDWCYAKLNADGTALVSTGVRADTNGGKSASRPVSERHIHPVPRIREVDRSMVATNGAERGLEVERGNCKTLNRTVAASATGAVTADPLASACRGGRDSTGFCNCLESPPFQCQVYHPKKEKGK